MASISNIISVVTASSQRRADSLDALVKSQAERIAQLEKMLISTKEHSSKIVESLNDTITRITSESGVLRSRVREELEGSHTLLAETTSTLSTIQRRLGEAEAALAAERSGREAEKAALKAQIDKKEALLKKATLLIESAIKAGEKRQILVSRIKERGGESILPTMQRRLEEAEATLAAERSEREAEKASLKARVDETEGRLEEAEATLAAERSEREAEKASLKARVDETEGRLEKATLRIATLQKDLGRKRIPSSLGTRIISAGRVVFIEKNTLIPVRREMMFTTVHEHVASISFSIFQWESPLEKDGKVIGVLDLDIPPLEKKSNIVMAFDIDADGILHVSAKEPVSGASKEIRVTPHFSAWY